MPRRRWPHCGTFPLFGVLGAQEVWLGMLAQVHTQWDGEHRSGPQSAHLQTGAAGAGGQDVPCRNLGWPLSVRPLGRGPGLNLEEGWKIIRRWPGYLR